MQQQISPRDCCASSETAPQPEDKIRRIVMSDSEAIVNGFVGSDYVSDGKWNGVPLQHAAWFPVAGVKMTIYKVAMTQSGEAYAKVTISASPAKGSIEKAIYRAADDGTLVAQDIELQPGLLCTETLRVVADGVKHELSFSDGSKGDWLCPHVPAAVLATSLHA
jgi:hypothetical protein